ncbi:hypothetical protein NBRC116493_34740 [Aurantivibrio infirmus]
MNIIYEIKFGLEFQAIYCLNYPSETELREDHTNGLLAHRLSKECLLVDGALRLEPDIFSGLARGNFALSKKTSEDLSLASCSDIDLVPFELGKNRTPFYTAIITNVIDVRDRELIKRNKTNPLPFNHPNRSFIDPNHPLLNRSMFFKMVRLGSLNNLLSSQIFFAQNDGGEGYNFLSKANALGLTGFQTIEICRSH